MEVVKVVTVWKIIMIARKGVMMGDIGCACYFFFFNMLRRYNNGEVPF